MEKDNNFYVFLFLVTEAVASDCISLGPKLSIEESESFGFFFGCLLQRTQGLEPITLEGPTKI